MKLFAPRRFFKPRDRAVAVLGLALVLAFNAAAVKFSFARAAAEPDAATVAITLGEVEPDFLFLIGQPLGISVAKRGAKGLWGEMPIFVNDVSGMNWE